MLNRFKIDHGTTSNKTYVYDKKIQQTIAEFRNKKDAIDFLHMKNDKNYELLQELKQLAMNAAYGLTEEQAAEWKIEEILERVGDEIRVTIDGFTEQNKMMMQAANNCEWVAEYFEAGALETETDF